MPGADAATDANPESPKKPEERDDEFQRGAKLTRAAGLWMIGALSAVGVGLFGAQPAVRGQVFSWADDSDRYQLIAAAILGSIGLVAIANLIYRIARLQAAVRYTLTTLPPERQSWINENAATELPENIPDLTTFQITLNSIRAKISDYEREIPRLRREIRAATVGDAQKHLLSDLAKYEVALEQLRENHAAYLVWKSKIINEAQEATLNEQLLGPKGKSWLVPTLIATIGIAGLLFTLALAKPPKEAPPTASPPELGSLQQGLDSQAAQKLWAALGLGVCEVRGKVPVLVLGEANNVTTVRTLAVNEGCREASFTVIAETAIVSKEVVPKVPIEYKPTEPTPTPSPS